MNRDNPEITDKSEERVQDSGVLDQLLHNFPTAPHGDQDRLAWFKDTEAPRGGGQGHRAYSSYRLLAHQAYLRHLISE